MKTIQLAHGNGGDENNHLIESVFLKAFANGMLQQEDSALLFDGKYAFTTDSFTVNPLFFNGGDIGKLSICGVCNDLAMMGAKPLYLSMSVIIEEGFSFDMLDNIVQSAKKELQKNGAVIVTGDTKVVPKNAVDKIFINCSGIGEVAYHGLSAKNIAPEDMILVSRDIGAHGATIFANREGIDLQTDLRSDCDSLWPIVALLLDSGITIKAMRDATRGGIAAVLNEWARASKVCLEIEEDAIAISQEVLGICELLGFEAYNLANEGTFVLAIASQDAKKALQILQRFSSHASIIGKATTAHLSKVILQNRYATQRFLEMPSGELLPRIC